MEDFYWYGQVPLADFGSVSASNINPTMIMNTY